MEIAWDGMTGQKEVSFRYHSSKEKTLYCPAAGFVRFQVQNDSETLAKEHNPICQPILNNSQFS